MVAVKPDGVQRGPVGDVMRRFERRGFKLVGLKMLQAPESVFAGHYHDLRRKPFYPALSSYMSSGPAAAVTREGPSVVSTSRAVIGQPDSAEAAPGAIGGDLSFHVSRNVVHASDSVEGAQREISCGSRAMSWLTGPPQQPPPGLSLRLPSAAPAFTQDQLPVPART